MASHGSHTWQESRKGRMTADWTGRCRSVSSGGGNFLRGVPSGGTGSYITFHRTLKTLFYIPAL